MSNDLLNIVGINLQNNREKNEQTKIFFCKEEKKK